MAPARSSAASVKALALTLALPPIHRSGSSLSNRSATSSRLERISRAQNQGRKLREGAEALSQKGLNRSRVGVVCAPRFLISFFGTTTVLSTTSGAGSATPTVSCGSDEAGRADVGSA
jgi:hypothetical protein